MELVAPLDASEPCTMSTGCGESWGESHRCNSDARTSAVRAQPQWYWVAVMMPAEDQAEAAEQDPVAACPGQHARRS